MTYLSAYEFLITKHYKNLQLLTYLLPWQNEQPACEKPLPFPQRYNMREKIKGQPNNPDSPVKQPLAGIVYVCVFTCTGCFMVSSFSLILLHSSLYVLIHTAFAGSKHTIIKYAHWQFVHSLFMAALWNRGAIIFLPCGYYLSFLLSFYLFFPRLISAAGDWMSTITSTHGVALVRI